MKLFLYVIIFNLALNVIAPNTVFALESNLTGQIEIKRQYILFDSLISIYNKLIDLTKKTIANNMRAVVKTSMALLTSMASLYIVVMGARSFITGSPFLTLFVEKMFLFIVLSALLQFDWYDKYILKNLENLFSNLPVLFNNGSGSVVENIIAQTSMISDKIWVKLAKLGWGLRIIATIVGFGAMFLLVSLTMVVLVNVLLISVEFYFVLSLSSIFILLFFFKFTRSLSLGAINVIFSAIVKITFLSFFLNIYGDLIAQSLTFQEDGDFFSACMGIILVASVGIILIKVVNDIANRVSGGMGGLIGKNIMQSIRN
jgi:hypothetical protein